MPNIDFRLISRIVRFTLIMVNLLGFLVLPAQRINTDSLKTLLLEEQLTDTRKTDLYNEISGSYQHVDFDSMFFYANKALGLAKTINYDFGLSKAYYHLGMVYIPWSNYENSLAFFDSCLTYSKTFDFPTTSMYALLGTGIAYEESGRYKESIAAYYEALDIAKSMDDQYAIGRLNNNLGQAYTNSGNYDSAIMVLLKALSNEEFKAKTNGAGTSLLIMGNVKWRMGELDEADDYFHQALSRFEAPNDMVRIASIHGYLGALSQSKGDLDSASYYYRQSLTEFRSIKHLKGESSLTARLAYLFMDLKQYDSAVDYLHRGLTMKEAIGDEQDVSQYMVVLSKAHENLGNYDEAKSFAVQAIRQADMYESLRESVEANKQLADLETAYGNFEEANSALYRYLTLSDSLLSNEKLTAINMLEAEFDFQLERDSLAFARGQELLLVEQDLKRKRLIQNASMVGLFLTVAIIGLLYNQVRIKSKNSKIIQEKSKELKQKNKQLKSLGKFKRQMTNMIVHDIKNPLNSIIWLSSSLPTQHSQKIVSASHTILRLVTNLLGIEKFESAKTDLMLTEVKLSELVRSARQEVELLMMEKTIQVDVDLKCDFVLHVDRDMITRVLVNLLSNAIKYNPSHSEIKIKAHFPDSESSQILEIKIIDQGPGISVQDQEKLFESFWQVDARDSGGLTSTGLGLSFCKLAVESHGGTIRVDSKEGEGSTFIVSLKFLSSGLNTQEEAPNVENGEFKLTRDEANRLKPFAEQLSKLKVYNISEVNRILEDLDRQSPGTTWITQMKSAVHFSNKDKYKSLIEMVNN